MVSFEEILQEVGPFGRCQKRVFLLLCLVSLPMAWIYVGIVFQGFTPEHWCRQPTVQEQRLACGWSLEESVSRTVPWVNVSGELQASSCLQYELKQDLNQSCELSQDLRVGPLVQCKNGWEYNYENRRSFVTEFDLVCGDEWMVDMYQSSLNLGFLIGSFVFGYAADRFGRRLSFLVCNLLSLISSAAIALTPQFLIVLLLRVILGLGTKGSWMTGYILLTEMVGFEQRRLVGILYQMVISLGIVAMVMLAYFLPDWRWIQAVCAAPYALFLFYYWFVPESPRWLLSQNRISEAREITEKIAKENKQELSEKSTKSFEALTEEPGDSPSASLLDLFRTPNMRKHTFILMFNWFCSALVYQGLIMRVGITEGNVYIDFLISGLVEFPAAFLILFTIERIGRRLPFATANFVAGASCFIAACIPESMYTLKTAVVCVGRLGITMAFEIVVFVNSELYPTFVRNLGVSVCSSLCDVGGILSPFILYRLAAMWVELPLIIFGAIAVVAGALVLLLPETRGVPLPETIDDIEFPNKKQNPEMEKLNHNAANSDVVV